MLPNGNLQIVRSSAHTNHMVNLMKDIASSVLKAQTKMTEHDKNAGRTSVKEIILEAE